MDGRTYFGDDEAGAQRFDELAAEMTVGDPGDGITPQQAILICDLVRNERLKEILWEDINSGGLKETYHNGRQRVTRDNSSVAKLMKLNDQQRRIMMSLGLIAREKNQPTADADDDGGFDDF